MVILAKFPRTPVAPNISFEAELIDILNSDELTCCIFKLR